MGAHTCGIFKFGQQPTVNKMEIQELLCQIIDELLRRSNGVRVISMNQEDPTIFPWRVEKALL